MSHDHAAEIDRHVRIYLLVFGSLLTLTLLTVGAWHFLRLGVFGTVAVALFIATVKASLVACFFMHLISERKLIFWILLLTVGFFFVLLLVPTWTSVHDQIGS